MFIIITVAQGQVSNTSLNQQLILQNHESGPKSDRSNYIENIHTQTKRQ